MNRLHVLAFAGMATALVLSAPGFAQTTTPSSMQSMSNPGTKASAPAPSASKSPSTLSEATSTTAGQQKAQKDKARAAKHQERMAMRGDCRTQGKQQGLTRQALKDYVKTCISGPH